MSKWKSLTHYLCPISHTSINIHLYAVHLVCGEIISTWIVHWCLKHSRFDFTFTTASNLSLKQAASDADNGSITSTGQNRDQERYPVLRQGCQVCESQPAQLRIKTVQKTPPNTRTQKYVHSKTWSHFYRIWVWTYHFFPNMDLYYQYYSYYLHTLKVAQFAEKQQTWQPGSQRIVDH